MEREIFLQQCLQEERIMNIKAYKAKIDKEQARMRREFLTNIFSNCGYKIMS